MLASWCLAAASTAGAAEPARKETKPAERPLPGTWWGLTNSVNSADLGLAKELRSLKWMDACVLWGRGVRSASMTAAANRKHRALELMLVYDELMPPAADVTRVQAKSIAIGMSACGVIAAIGKPSDINETVTASSSSAQLVYDRHGSYVYVDGPAKDWRLGKVRTIQR